MSSAETLVALVARCVVGLTLIIAGLSKVRTDTASFQHSIQQLGIKSRVHASLVATTLPRLEVILGAALILGFLMPLPAVIASVLFVLFTFLIVRAQLSGIHPPCACFGSIENASPLSWFHAARSMGFATLGFVASGALFGARWARPFAWLPTDALLSIQESFVAGLASLGIVLAGMTIASLWGIVRTPDNRSAPKHGSLAHSLPPPGREFG
ncbi:MAG: MauE/DoxX family redox-associated membrane protein [Planctomycetales bacterium]